MNLDEITKIVENMGIKGVIITPLIFIIYVLFKTKYIQDILSKISDAFIEKLIRNKVSNNVERNLNDSDIENHDIFNQISFWLYSIVYTLAPSSRRMQAW